MKITIHNFGPIERFEYDLSKDLIVTYGDNNIGKSYAMQVVYLLLKNMLEVQALFYNSSAFHFEAEAVKNNKKLQELLSQLYYIDKTKLDVTECQNELFFCALEELLNNAFRNSLMNTFGNVDRTFTDQSSIIIESEKYNICICLKDCSFTGEIKTDRTLELHDFGQENDAWYELVEHTVTLDLQEFFDSISKFVQAVYYLPASRSGIYSGMSAFAGIVAELSKSRAYLTKKIELPGLSEPNADYFIKLSNIDSHQESQRFAKYYSQIEKNILKGRVGVNKEKSSVTYEPENMTGVPLEMVEVSSMVSEIAPIVAFLKFILQGKETEGKSLFFIEEPEAHLHPGNQIELIEILAQMSSEVKIVMSSHSNYVFNKLNNLVLSKKLDHNTYEPILLEMKENGSVSRKMSIDELGVDDENFADVSELLYEEREAIIQAIMEADHD